MAHSRIAGPDAGQKRTRGGTVVTLLGALFIGWMTLRPTAAEADSVVPQSYLLTDVLLNVVLFVPLGVGLGLQELRPYRTFLAGGLVSGAIEVSQWLWIPGRDATWHDVAGNATGAFLGAILAAGWAERARWWRVSGPLLAAALLSAWCLATTLVRPSYPLQDPWWGQWGHQLGGLVPFPGRILSFTVNGAAIPDGRLPDWKALGEELRLVETVTATVSFVAGGSVAGRAQVVGLVTQRGAEILGIWQDGNRFTGRWRLRIGDATLRVPVVWLPDRPAPLPGDTVTVRFSAGRRALGLEASWPGGGAIERVPLAPELAWIGLVPYEYRLTGATLWLPLLGLGILFFLVGAGLTHHPAAATMATVVGLAFGPLVASTAPPGQSAWVVGSLATLLGWLIGRRLRL